jgi:dTDP-4-amino-4,6-dideoxygalactose transaminase
VNRIQFVDLQRQTRTLRPDLLHAIEGVLDRADFVSGAAVERFEQEFARFCGKRHCVAMNSGTDALELALRAYGVEGGEVITAPNSYFSSAMVISKVGATPVFVDVDERSFNLDPQKLAAAITPRTRAIIPVHLCGQPADLDPIYEIARRSGAVVIEDCCQAHGAEYRGRRLPFGDTGCFSFYPGKNLGCFGDGGALCTDDGAVADRARILRNDGSRHKYEHEAIGCKSRLDTLQAVVLLEKLKHLADWNERRRSCAARYRELLSGVVDVPAEMPYAKHVYHLFVIGVRDRDGLRDHLDRLGIATVIHYPIPIHLQKAYATAGFKRGDFPVSERLADRILSLPMFPELTDEEITTVAEGVRSFVSGASSG